MPESKRVTMSTREQTADASSQIKEFKLPSVSPIRIVVQLGPGIFVTVSLATRGGCGFLGASLKPSPAFIVFSHFRLLLWQHSQVPNPTRMRKEAMHPMKV